MKILPILADIANGIFATLIAGYVTGTDIVWWYFLVGIPLAMLPDLDALSELLRRGKVSSYSGYTKDHREGLHYPLAFVVVGVALVYVHPFFGSLFLAATTLHFINDLYGTGWGIKLFWPFSSRYYKFFSRRAGRLKSILVADGDWEQLPESERTLHVLMSWSKEEMPHYIERWGMDEWIEPYYLRLNWISGIEYFLFVIALGVAGFTLLY